MPKNEKSRSGAIKKNPNRREDMLTERDRPGLHGGEGSPDSTGRPKNREVEDEMVKLPAKDGKPPKPATEPGK